MEYKIAQIEDIEKVLELHFKYQIDSIKYLTSFILLIVVAGFKPSCLFLIKIFSIK